MLPASGGAMVFTPGINLAITRVIAALVKRFSGAQDAGLRIDRDAAQNTKQRPSGVAAQRVHEEISADQSKKTNHKH